jgi:hypothetical protein
LKALGLGPSDGSEKVWSLEFDIGDEDPPETAMLRMPIPMEERCTIFENLRVKFYKDLRDVKD